MKLWCDTETRSAKALARDRGVETRAVEQALVVEIIGRVVQRRGAFAIADMGEAHD